MRVGSLLAMLTRVGGCLNITSNNLMSIFTMASVEHDTEVGQEGGMIVDWIQ